MSKGVVEQLLSKASGQSQEGPAVDVDVEAAKAAVARLRACLAASDDKGGADAIRDLLKLSA